MSDLAELRCAIDDLVLRLVVDPPEKTTAAALAPAFEQVRELALRQSVGAVAEAAGAALARLASGDDLVQSISNLQQALDVCERTGSAGVPASTAELGHDPELLSDFVVESREHLAAIESQVLAIERDPRNAEALNSVF